MQGKWWSSCYVAAATEQHTHTKTLWVQSSCAINHVLCTQKHANRFHIHTYGPCFLWMHETQKSTSCMKKNKINYPTEYWMVSERQRREPKAKATTGTSAAAHAGRLLQLQSPPANRLWQDSADSEHCPQNCANRRSLKIQSAGSKECPR